MQITDVRVKKLSEEGKMRCIASVTFDDEFVVHDIKVVERQGGLFLAMPSVKTSNGEYRDVAHPISKNMRVNLQNKIIEAYQKALIEVGEKALL